MRLWRRGCCGSAEELKEGEEKVKRVREREREMEGHDEQKEDVKETRGENMGVKRESERGETIYIKTDERVNCLQL